MDRVVPPARLCADGAGDGLTTLPVSIHEAGEPFGVGVTIGVGEDKNVAAGALCPEVACLVREEALVGPDTLHFRESANDLGGTLVRRAIDNDDLEVPERLFVERPQAAFDRRVGKVGGKDNGCCRHAETYFLANSSSTTTKCSPESPGPPR